MKIQQTGQLSPEIRELLLQTIHKVVETVNKWDRNRFMYPSIKFPTISDSDFSERTMLLFLAEMDVVSNLNEDIPDVDNLYFSVDEKKLMGLEKYLKKQFFKKLPEIQSIYDYKSFDPLITYAKLPEWRQMNIKINMLHILNQLWQLCDSDEQELEFIWPTSAVRTNSSQVGFLFLDNLRFLEGMNILDRITTKQISNTKRIYTAIVFKDALCQYICDFHDKHEMKHGSLIRFPQQKKNLLSLIKKKSEVGDNEEVVISEKDLGTFEYSNEEQGHPYYDEIFCMPYATPASSYEFMKALNSLKEDGDIEIVDTDFSLDAFSQLVDESGITKKCVPAQHCIVTVKLNKYKKIVRYASNVSQQNVVWPKEFQWSKHNDNIFEFGDSRFLTFRDKNDDNIRKQIFEMLTIAEGKFVEVGDMAKLVGRSGGYIRTTLGQLQRKIDQEYNEVAEIEARDTQKSPGAYRIVPKVSKKKM